MAHLQYEVYKDKRYDDWRWLCRWCQRTGGISFNHRDQAKARAEEHIRTAEHKLAGATPPRLSR